MIEAEALEGRLASDLQMVKMSDEKPKRSLFRCSSLMYVCSGIFQSLT